ncbi:MAG: hypothetical protein IJS15_02730, partial [Victivallales bacterium]|nr:hypothetical protein [Victivallales bacterium]
MEKQPKSTDKSLESEVAEFKKHYEDSLKYTLGLGDENITEQDHYHAIALAVRDKMMEKWIETQGTYNKTNPREVYYLSLEFLIG